ncbi:hypothetical protein DER46DRAFT_157808 [Fusarium sp. MPI-SDFR-AT-0072]|nr:hypothetical protein DER46DRAFT_157808 [Fusarium sp. MPI-SDFR-AT-0072]
MYALRCVALRCAALRCDAMPRHSISRGANTWRCNEAPRRMRRISVFFVRRSRIAWQAVSCLKSLTVSSTGLRLLLTDVVVFRLNCYFRQKRGNNAAHHFKVRVRLLETESRTLAWQGPLIFFLPFFSLGVGPQKVPEAEV